MKKIYFTIAVLLYAMLPTTTLAQRSAKQEKIPIITEEERKQSVVFADGLRAFYSDDFTTAEKSFRTVILQNPQNDAAFFMLSKIRRTNKDYAGAAYYIGEARKLNKHNEWYLVEIAEIHDYLADYKQSSKYWEEICKLKPDNEYYLFALAESYLNQEKYTEVIKVYDRMEKILGVNDEISDAKKNIYLHLNDVKSAVGEFDRLIKLYPYETKYYVQAANIYITNNYLDKALPYLESALKIDKNDPLVHLILANYYKLKGKSDDSYRSLVIAFRNPNLVIEEKLSILQEYFTNAYKTKDDKEIRRTRNLVDAMIEAHPESVIAWSTLAGLQMLKGSFQEARVTLEKSLSLDPSDYVIWENYIVVLRQLKDYETIVNNTEEILELFPTNSMMLYNIGLAYLQLKQSEKAINYLNQASMYAYETALLAGIYETMGDAYWDMENKEEALKSWKSAQKKGVNNQSIKEKIDKAETTNK